MQAKCEEHTSAQLTSRTAVCYSALMENRLTINLPESARDFVESKAKAQGFASPGEFVIHLIEKACDQETRHHVERLLQEGYDSGFSEMTQGDWASLRERATKARS